MKFDEVAKSWEEREREERSREVASERSTKGRSVESRSGPVSLMCTIWMKPEEAEDEDQPRKNDGVKSKGRRKEIAQTKGDVSLLQHDPPLPSFFLP